MALFFWILSRIDLKEAIQMVVKLEWEFDPEDEILGQRLQLKGFEGEFDFHIEIPNIA